MCPGGTAGERFPFRVEQRPKKGQRRLYAVMTVNPSVLPSPMGINRRIEAGEKSRRAGRVSLAAFREIKVQLFGSSDSRATPGFFLILFLAEAAGPMELDRVEVDGPRLESLHPTSIANFSLLLRFLVPLGAFPSTTRILKYRTESAISSFRRYFISPS